MMIRRSKHLKVYIVNQQTGFSNGSAMIQPRRHGDPECLALTWRFTQQTSHAKYRIALVAARINPNISYTLVLNNLNNGISQMIITAPASDWGAQIPLPAVFHCRDHPFIGWPGACCTLIQWYWLTIAVTISWFSMIILLLLLVLS